MFHFEVSESKDLCFHVVLSLNRFLCGLNESFEEAVCDDDGCFDVCESTTV